MRRRVLVADVARRLGTRQLVWFGTRGEDVESAADLPHLSAAFSIIGGYRRRATVEGTALEDLTGARVDLDLHDIDEDPYDEHVRTLRRAMYRSVSRPSAVFTYRPSTFLSAICFARSESVQYLGMFKDHQQAFEHKPWVESSVASLGVPAVRWNYVADEDQLETVRLLIDGPVVLRRSRSSGGVGVARLDDARELAEAWPRQDEAFVAVAPFIEGGIPLNVGGVVWHDGVTLHPASIQLIGVEELTNRPFGYCGNDFAAARDLDFSTLAEADRASRVVGEWLRAHGYRGAFGVDFLVKAGRPLFMEVNPRFQGSTHASCQISVEMDESCILLEHLAANLGLDAPHDAHLPDLARNAPDLSHFVVHAPGDEPALLSPTAVVEAAEAMPGFCRTDILTRTDLRTNPGATVARVTVRSGVTADGFSIAEPWRQIAGLSLQPGHLPLSDPARNSRSTSYIASG